MVYYNIFAELIILLISLIGIIYIYGCMKLVDHKLYYGWRFVFWAYILFILVRLIKIFGYNKNIGYYVLIGEIFFILLLTIAMVTFNKELRNVVNHKRKK